MIDKSFDLKTNLFIFTSKIAPYLLLLFLVVVTIDDVVYQLVRSDEKSPVTIKKSEKGEQKTNPNIVDDARRLSPIHCVLLSLTFYFFYKIGGQKKKGGKQQRESQTIT